MLQRGASSRNDLGHRGPDASASQLPKVVFAVAQAPPFRDPARWGWPEWLAPYSRAGGHAPVARSPEDYL